MGALVKWEQPKVGDTRDVRRVLLFPRYIAGEWRWLGFETIKQERVTSCRHGTDWWLDKEWAA